MIPGRSWFRVPAVWTALGAHLAALDEPAIVFVVDRGEGQEAYTAAMALHDAGASGTVRGALLDRTQLPAARAGRYTARTVEADRADLGHGRLRRHFTRDAGYYQVQQHIRRLVRFDPRGVADPPPLCDAAVVRNVWDRITPPARAQLVAHLHAVMPAGALLLLGGVDLTTTDLTVTGDLPRYFAPTGHDMVWQRR